LDIKQLRYFIGVIEKKSFTRAAEHLAVAQPALGLKIRKLEEELGTTLLIRHSRGIEPTDAGLLLLERARDIVARVDAASQELRDFDGAPRGRIVLGMTPSLSLVAASDLIRRSAATLPLVKVKLVEELSLTLVRRLHEERLDAALAFNVQDDEELRSEPLIRETLFFVERVTTDVVKGETIAFRDVARIPLMLNAQPHVARRLLEETAERLGLELNVAVEMDSVYSLKDLVEQGVAATVLPYGAVARMVDEGRLRARRIVDPELTRVLSLVRLARRPVAKADLALDALIRQVMLEKTHQFPGIWTPLFSAPP
jgi:LysR family nitrogen assimilation transcriptional regulator